jgi:hypothetical protein
MGDPSFRFVPFGMTVSLILKGLLLFVILTSYPTHVNLLFIFRKTNSKLPEDYEISEIQSGSVFYVTCISDIVSIM